MISIQKSIQLTSSPLEKLLSTKRTTDFRSNEAAWQNLKEGDIIEFWEDFSGFDKTPHPSARRAFARLNKIVKAKSFDELFDKLATPYPEKTLQNLRKWWTKEEEKAKGVLAFEVSLIER